MIKKDILSKLICITPISPMIPIKEISYKALGEKQKELLQIIGETRPCSQSKKLIQTLADKKHYTMNYVNLKLYVSLGMGVTKVPRALKFRQSYWLRPHMQLNTEKKKESRNKFEECFFKLLNNSCYGKP